MEASSRSQAASSTCRPPASSTNMVRNTSSILPVWLADTSDQKPTRSSNTAPAPRRWCSAMRYVEAMHRRRLCGVAVDRSQRRVAAPDRIKIALVEVPAPADLRSVWCDGARGGCRLQLCHHALSAAPSGRLAYVDGRTRAQCVLAVATILKEHGHIILDDGQRERYEFSTAISIRSKPRAVSRFSPSQGSPGALRKDYRPPKVWGSCGSFRGGRQKQKRRRRGHRSSIG